MIKSEQINEIAGALLQFSIKIDKIAKTSQNPFFKSKYAALPEILEAIKMPLNECGLTIAQFPDGEGLTTILMHTSGQWIESNATMHPVKNDPQSMGSAITYQRRYSIASILSLNIDEDDDGNKASTPAKSNDKPDLPWLNENTEEFNLALEYVRSQPDKNKAIEQLRKKKAISKKTAEALLK